ncbi:MAG: MacB family efflux pump subunit, partial [Steroidobacteraceae bacterium]|nr:MacB family efflux pump subunit [Steroidobacteraceae bacterium]
MTGAPLLEVRALRREFPAGEDTIAVLKDADLDIHAGEMVAIVGASGSGKSTLMNILGCLDRPTSGTYRVAGRETAQMSPDELAALRREHFGFIFQRYHLLGDLNALGNVEVPAIYAGQARGARQERARQLLTRLGLQDRMGHKPGQLSGGQQQRVSIARALMNGGKVILADEPTGALDSRSGEEVMRILEELHAEGHTIILVTHDMAVARHAQRIIEIRDGQIVADRRNAVAPTSEPQRRAAAPPRGSAWQGARDRFIEAFRMALLAMRAHKMRTFLTMLGIIIGTASVVSVVALGNGSQQRILSNISALGTNTIDIYPGTGFGDMRSGRVQTLRASDAEALAAQSYIDSATPSVSTSVTARYGSHSATAQVTGVGEQFFRVRGMKIIQGTAFDAAAVRRIDQSVVIDQNTVTQLFPNENPIGKVILLGNVPSRIIGVAERQGFGPMGGGNSLNVWIPYTTALTRMLGQTYLSSITVRIADDTPMDAAQEAITRLLTLRHGRQDFFLNNTAEIRETIEATTQTMTLLIGSIAAIALIVGGIGVMNIMLVSVTERTREIGVRVAVGGRQSDILQQFLIEAVLVCIAGGMLGVGLALVLGLLVGQMGGGFGMVFS